MEKKMRKCTNKPGYHKDYYRSKKGVFTKIYSNQRNTSKVRGHNPPTYTKEELIIWLNDNGFDELYDNWVKSDYERYMVPSCDRLDDSIGYQLDNLRLVTWQENLDKANQDNRDGKFKKEINPSGWRKTYDKVLQYDMNDNLINEFLSPQDAADKCGFKANYIISCCRGTKEHYHGFKWCYK